MVPEQSKKIWESQFHILVLDKDILVRHPNIVILRRNVFFKGKIVESGNSNSSRKGSLENLRTSESQVFLIVDLRKIKTTDWFTTNWITLSPHYDFATFLVCICINHGVCCIMITLSYQKNLSWERLLFIIDIMV